MVHNDQAYDTSLPPDSACPSSLTDADDCGEAIHLLGVSWSKVIGNNVFRNVGGILVTDGGFGISVGPAAHNLIAFNHSTQNAFDCGVALPGHDPRAVATTGPNAGKPQPSLAGVYDNLVLRNVSNRNGAAGLLDATPYPEPAHTTMSLPATPRAATGTPASSSIVMRLCKTSAALS